MSRRSTPQKTADDAAFPIRIKVRVPGCGLGQSLDAMHKRLAKEAGRGDYAHHSAGGPMRDATAFYFRDIRTAHAFLLAFPMLALADDVRRFEGG